MGDFVVHYRNGQGCHCCVTVQWFFNFVAWYYIVAIVSHTNLIFHSVFNLKLLRREKVPRIA